MNNVAEKQPKTISIFESVEAIQAKPGTPGGRPIHARGTYDRAIYLVETGVDVLSQNMASFVEGVSIMLSAGEQVAGSFEIETVEIECQISGTGKIGFAGTGLDLQGGSTLKIIFKKRAKPMLK